MTSSDQNIIEKLDEVMGKLRAMEEEFTLQMGKYESINDLENRIEFLESTVKKLEQSSK